MNFYPHIFYWPRILNLDRMWSWEIAGGTRSGGRALSGLMPSMRLDGGGYWTAALSDVRVNQTAQVLCWRALTARLDGGAAPFVMEMREPRFPPWPTVSGEVVTEQYQSTNSDGSSCSDGTGYVSDAILASLVEAAPLRSTTIKVAIASGAPLQGGEHLSIQHDTFSHRLYRVGRVTVDGDGNSLVGIRPPLREATAAGTRVEFDYPKCIMKLATQNAMDLPLELRFFGKASPKLVEDFPPFDLVEEPE